MRAIVFANGPMSAEPAPGLDLAPDDLLIACDGGARHCRALGLTPEIVVGDLDSIEADEVAVLVALGAELVRYPTDKDATDLDLALQLARARGADEALVFGGLGARWDMTLANVGLVLAPHLAGLSVRLVDGGQTLWPLAGGAALSLAGAPGDLVSLIPWGGDAEGVATEGLVWPLADETLPAGSTRGVSNVLVASRATVRLRRGRLVCIHTHSPAAESPDVRRPIEGDAHEVR